MLLATFSYAGAQYVIKQADAKAGLYNYANAIPLYKKAYDKKGTAAAARGVAEGYRRINDYIAAAPWYAKLVALPEHTIEDELHYAAILMNNGSYAEARPLLDSVLAKTPGNTVAANMRKGCDSAARWMKTPVRGDLVNMQALNSTWSDWSTEFRDGKIFFASDRPFDVKQRKGFIDPSGITKKYYNWTGNNYLHLYESDGEDSASTQLLTQQINGDYHSASMSYTGDGNRRYYAVTEMQRQKGSLLGKEEPYTLNVEILEQQYDTINRGWRQASRFPYNDLFNYSIGDPYITADGKTLYFVSSVGENSHGGMDIYYSRINENGQWQVPVNMGPEINTAGNERTPVFADDTTFYFASDGHVGVGGLDIYKAIKTGDSWKITNMRSPVNTPQDDFAPAIEGNALYFSSNRPGGKGSDDIYRFVAAKILMFSLSGKVMAQGASTRLAGVVVTLENKQTGASLQTVSDESGYYHFVLDSLSAYDLGAVKAGFNPAAGAKVTTIGLTESTALRQDILLDKFVINKPVIAPEVKFGREPVVLGKPIELQGIRFAVAKADITPASAKELDKLVKILNDNPALKMELSAHTDSRGNDAANMKLSQRRADATMLYLVSKGIDHKRLTAKGYGESQLTNRCGNNVRCTEAEHAENRRTTFTLLDK